MTKASLRAFVLFVNDVQISRAFYEEYLDQEVAMDINGINVMFKSGLAIWQAEYAHKTLCTSHTAQPGETRNIEIYFETAALEETYNKISAGGFQLLHAILPQPWQQRVFRVIDPDGFIVEVAESMEDTVRRLKSTGHSTDEIASLCFLPNEFIANIR